MVSADKARKQASVGKKAKRPTSQQTDAMCVGRARSIFMMISQLACAYHNEAELAAMNHGKRGRPYKYTHSLIVAISGIRDWLRLDFRSCEGLMPEDEGPRYTTIFKRINEQCASVRVMHRLRRGFLMLTIMINKKILEIVVFRLTDDTVGEPTVFGDLLNDALVNMGVNSRMRRRVVEEQRDRPDKTYQKITPMADGGYDTREIFSVCKKLCIETGIRVRRGANAHACGVDRARNEAVLDQFGGGKDTTPAQLAAMDEWERKSNRRKWMERVGCGTRWLVDIVISAFKRTYSDAVCQKDGERAAGDQAEDLYVQQDAAGGQGGGHAGLTGPPSAALPAAHLPPHGGSPALIRDATSR